MLATTQTPFSGAPTTTEFRKLFGVHMVLACLVPRMSPWSSRTLTFSPLRPRIPGACEWNDHGALMLRSLHIRSGNAKWPFSLSHNRLQTGGWARQENSTFPENVPVMAV